MSYTLVNLPIYPDPFYDYTVDLQGESIKLRFVVNVRQNLYHFDVVSDSDVVIVEGVALLPNTPLCERYDLSSFGLTGYFYLAPINLNTSFENLSTESLPDYYQFFYVFEDEE